jgi:hypothetical protein
MEQIQTYSAPTLAGSTNLTLAHPHPAMDPYFQRRYRRDKLQAVGRVNSSRVCRLRKRPANAVHKLLQIQLGMVNSKPMACSRGPSAAQASRSETPNRRSLTIIPPITMGNEQQAGNTKKALAELARKLNRR